MSGQVVTRGRSFERLVNFSDAVVAVAVTVLVLPIVDIAAPSGDQTMWDVITANSGQLVAYVVTFYVVIMLWLVHHRLFTLIDGYDTFIFAANTVWLISLAFLPWPGNMIEDVDSFASGVGALYFGCMALNTAMMTLMMRHVRRTPALVAPGIELPDRPDYRGPVFFVLLIILAISSVIAPSLTPILTIALPVMSFVLPKALPKRTEPEQD